MATPPCNCGFCGGFEERVAKIEYWAWRLVKGSDSHYRWTNAPTDGTELRCVDCGGLRPHGWDARHEGWQQSYDGGWRCPIHWDLYEQAYYAEYAAAEAAHWEEEAQAARQFKYEVTRQLKKDGNALALAGYYDDAPDGEDD